MVKSISKSEFILKEYFSMKYLLKYGYFDFKYYSYKFEEDYILSNMVFKKVFNTKDLQRVYFLLKKKVKFDSFKETVPLELSTYKNDNERRLLKLPNMYSYICLCEHLNKNQGIYMDVLAASNKSLSSSFYSTTFLSNKIIREDNRIGKRKLFKTDIQNFYPSLYTHSIPWIFVGKVEAKRMKDDKKIYYNELDNLIQRCQMGETHGLPTGSFASRLIAEIYMCKLDLSLKDYEYVRYVDDFEFPHNDESEKNLFYKKLNKELTSLNLKIKVEKNQVDSFPFQESNNSAFYFDYFSNNSGSIKNQQKRVYNFIEECIFKEREGYKGSLKLMFRALEEGIYKSELDKETFTINMLNKLFNIVLMQPKLSVYYLEFIDVLNKKEEVKLGLQRLKKEIRININRYIDLDYNEELYSLLSIFYYMDITTICTIKQLFEVIKYMDDLSSTLAFEILLQDQNNINDWLFEALESKLANSTSWQEEFWFFKYHIINRINLDKRKMLHKKYKDYLYRNYANGLTKDKFFNQKNLKNIKSPINCDWQHHNSMQDIQLFYKELLINNVSFIKIK
ncbi:RNA-directed DNA polymerase [Carnobacterium jeotgali]|uniref:RNA-directed DNA polymerase n=1 Tax=Carnobacterium jeotgali TaxID=545534 RepID=UPI0038905C8F